MSDAIMFSSTKQLPVHVQKKVKNAPAVSSLQRYYAFLNCWLISCQTSMSQWKWQGFHLCKTPGCGATLHLDPECCSKFWYGDAENSNPRGSRFSSRHKNDKSVTGAKKMIVYKVCNKLGCTHKDPTKWKQETHKEYVQKKWREGRPKEDLVDLNCLHCGGLLEEEPRK